jgi:hypothetical protein
VSDIKHTGNITSLWIALFSCRQVIVCAEPYDSESALKSAIIMVLCFLIFQIENNVINTEMYILIHSTKT